MLRRILLIVMIVCLTVTAYGSIIRVALRPLVELPALPGGFMLSTLSLWLFSLCHALYTLGWRHALLFFALSAAISWGFEQVGVATGVIYGPYHYTDRLGARLGDVPMLIPIAWFMMIYPSYVVANLIGGEPPTGSRGGALKIIWLSLLSAGVMTAWDLSMDPWLSGPPMQAWVWEAGGDYFGVPLQNFVGWLATTFTIYLAYRFIERRWPPRPLVGLTPATTALPLVAYGLMMLLALLPSAQPAAVRIIAPFVMGLPLLAAVGRLGSIRRDQD